MTPDDLFAKLCAPFPPDRVSWRVGSTNMAKDRGMALAYIDARDVQDRLNEACGPFGWQAEHVVAPDGKKVTCRIGIKNPETGEWIFRSDGAGETDFEGEKGSYSDSLKRAAVSFGVGRYLYDVDAPWVAIEQMGKSYKIKDSEKERLASLLAGKEVLVTERKVQEAKADAREWVDHQIERIFQFDTMTEMDEWETKVTPALVRLQKVDPDQHARLMEKMQLVYERLPKK